MRLFVFMPRRFSSVSTARRRSVSCRRVWATFLWWLGLVKGAMAASVIMVSENAFMSTSTPCSRSGPVTSVVWGGYLDPTAHVAQDFGEAQVSCGKMSPALES